MRTFNVVFHRHYEITEEDIQDYKDDYAISYNFDTPEEEAEAVARRLLEAELNNAEDFVSVTVEPKRKEDEG